MDWSYCVSASWRGRRGQLIDESDLPEGGLFTVYSLRSRFYYPTGRVAMHRRPHKDYRDPFMCAPATRTCSKCDTACPDTFVV